MENQVKQDPHGILKKGPRYGRAVKVGSVGKVNIRRCGADNVGEYGNCLCQVKIYLDSMFVANDY